ncbi:MAG: S8 family serine peptidase, partial [Geobacteraceae bacterium]|nr:S8 family serine peptidase [Geobacteraceae bacterium]
MKKNRFIAMLLAVTMMVIGTLSSASAAEQAETMSLVVKLINGLTAVEQTAVIDRNGGIETSSIPALRLHVIAVPATNFSLTLENYQTDSQVESVELNKTRKAEGIPGDLSYGVQWALSKIGWESAFGTITPTGSAKLAILDTGVDASHPDLNSNIIPGTSILNGTNGLSDPNGHGTSLAGIVAALTDNGEGIAGISYAGVHIMPVTVLGANGVGQDSDIIAGIIWAADNGADVILMGFSNPDFSQNLQDAIDYAWSKGAVMVAAAGNDGMSTPTFPAGHRGVVGVSATDPNDALYVGSNYGQQVFLAAPGTDIYTTGLDNSYDYISGTSASSAIVAGVAAFMKAVDPALTNGVIVGRLARSADAVGTVDDPNNPTMFGNGRVNMASALVNDITDEVQPTGAAPVGVGGPFVGPYTAACSIPRTIVSISSSPQQSALTSGIAKSTTYNITVKAGEGSSNTATLTVMGLPTGATALFAAKPLKLNNKTVYTSMTVTTAASTLAGNFPLTIENSSNDVTGHATLVIGNAAATLTLGDLTQTYDGTPKAATVTTSPAGLIGVAVTYDGSAVPPSAIGSYAVVATLTNDNYQAANATGTLVIGKGTATLTLGGLNQEYNTTPKAVTVTTSPAGLTGVAVTYDGSAVAPTNPGSYAVVATLTNDNYQAADATG